MSISSLLSFLKRTWRLWGLLLILVPITVAFIFSAWFGDDAYISFRTVDNFVQGHGLGWNVGERSQAYTHPLWMFLHVPLYAISGDIAWSSIVISATCIIGAFWLMSQKLASSFWALVCGAALCISSHAFTDYMNSGLENPLTFVFIALFCSLLLGPEDRDELPEQEANSPKVWWLSMVIGLAMFNRMDTLLLFAPAMLGHVFLSAKMSKRRLLEAASGGLVIGGWMLFSLIYYGVPVPNTAYAKLGTGLGRWDLIKQAKYYFRDSIEMDPITIPAILGIFAVTWLYGSRRSRWLALGLPIYLLYVVKIGGDFMSGRFFAAPLFMAACLLVRAKLPFQFRTLCIPVVFLAVSLLGRHPLITQDSMFFLDRRGIIGAHGVADERQFYYPSTSLRYAMLKDSWPFMGFDRSIKKRREQQEKKREKEGTQDRLVMVHGNIGFMGFYAGEPIHIVDNYALADPLLSKLPAQYYSGWRIGHFRRKVPQGYIDSIKKGENLIKDPDTKELYEHVKRMTQGPIWSADRFWSIWWFNTGQLKHLVNEDEAHFWASRKVNPNRFRRPKKDGAAWHIDTVKLSHVGIKADYPERQKAKRVWMSSDANDPMKIFFVRDKKVVWVKDLKAKNRAGLFNRRFDLPEELATKGFDGVRIFYTGYDKSASVGHFLFDEDPGDPPKPSPKKTPKSRKK